MNRLQANRSLLAARSMEDWSLGSEVSTPLHLNSEAGNHVSTQHPIVTAPIEVRVHCGGRRVSRSLPPSLPKVILDTLNVWKEQLPEFDQEAIGAKYKGINKEPMDEAEQKVWSRI